MAQSGPKNDLQIELNAFECRKVTAECQMQFRIPHPQPLRKMEQKLASHGWAKSQCGSGSGSDCGSISVYIYISNPPTWTWAKQNYVNTMLSSIVAATRNRIRIQSPHIRVLSRSPGESVMPGTVNPEPGAHGGLTLCRMRDDNFMFGLCRNFRLLKIQGNADYDSEQMPTNVIKVNSDLTANIEAN